MSSNETFSLENTLTASDNSSVKPDTLQDSIFIIYKDEHSSASQYMPLPAFMEKWGLQFKQSPRLVNYFNAPCDMTVSFKGKVTLFNLKSGEFFVDKGSDTALKDERFAGCDYGKFMRNFYLPPKRKLSCELRHLIQTTKDLINGRN